MDIEKYIASGILEAYALDDLSAEEKAGVEEVLAQYPELKLELDAIEEGLEELALETAIVPPAFLKENILAELEKTTTPPVEKERIKESVPAEKDTRVVPMRTSGTSVWSYVAAASVILTLVSSYLAVDYRNRWKDTQLAYVKLEGANNLVSDNYNQVNQSLEELQRDIKVMSDFDFTRVQMASTTDDKAVAASVFWNEKTLEAFLSVGNLKALAAEQQYQLWAIVDGKPVDMGVFDSDAGGLLKMKSVSNAATFAVTIEPKGGSVNPTLEAMQVAGNV